MYRESFEFEIEVRLRGEARPLIRESIDRGYLQPLIEDAIFTAQRRGMMEGDSNAAECAVEPVFGGGRGRLAGVRVHLRRSLLAGSATRTDAETDSHLAMEYDLEILKPLQNRAVARLLQEKRLSPNDDYETSVHAHRPQVPFNSAPSDQSAARRAPLLWMDGELEAWQRRATLLNEELQREDDPQVFILRQAFEAARSFSRAGGTREGGALLVGRLVRQVHPQRELFAVIEAAFEARHADQQQFSLTLSNETYLYFEKQLARRRHRLGRPEEMHLGIAHGHNFLPALGADGGALCPSCPKRTTCDLDSAFYSADDGQFHRGLYNKQPFAVGIVFGLTPREEDRVRVFGASKGVLKERSIWLVD